MIKSVKAGRGGKRLGAGRPSTWGETRDFKTIRVPVSLASQLLEVARYLDGQQVYCDFQSFEDDESPDFDLHRAVEFRHLHYCVGFLGYEKKLLQREVDSLKAQLKSIRKQRFKVL